jgi:hypothetical protein
VPAQQDCCSSAPTLPPPLSRRLLLLAARLVQVALVAVSAAAAAAAFPLVALVSVCQQGGGGGSGCPECALFLHRAVGARPTHICAGSGSGTVARLQLLRGSSRSTQPMVRSNIICDDLTTQLGVPDADTVSCLLPSADVVSVNDVVEVDVLTEPARELVAARLASGPADFEARNGIVYRLLSVGSVS